MRLFMTIVAIYIDTLTIVIKFCFLTDGCHFEGRKKLKKNDEQAEVIAIFVAQTATTSLNTRSKKCSQSWCQKWPKKGAAACNPQALAKSLT